MAARAGGNQEAAMAAAKAKRDELKQMRYCILYVSPHTYYFGDPSLLLKPSLLLSTSVLY